MFPELAEQMNITKAPVRNTSFSKNLTQDNATSSRSFFEYGTMFAAGAALVAGVGYGLKKGYDTVFSSSNSTTPPPPVPTPANVVSPAAVYEAMNSDPDTAIKFAHEIKHINL